MRPNLRLLLVSEPFGAALGAPAAARWLARGLQDGGLPAPDVLALPGGLRAGARAPGAAGAGALRPRGWTHRGRC